MLHCTTNVMKLYSITMRWQFVKLKPPLPLSAGLSPVDKAMPPTPIFEVT